MLPLSVSFLGTLMQVILIDLLLAGDNAVVISMAAAGLPSKSRLRAVAIGIGAATALRIVFTTIAAQLLSVTGLLLAGGLLLSWVCLKMYQEIRQSADTESIESGSAHRPAPARHAGPLPEPQDLYLPWRRVPALLSAAARRNANDFSRTTKGGAQEEAKQIHIEHVSRHYSVHA